jgi:hypothetical protein
MTVWDGGGRFFDGVSGRKKNYMPVMIIQCGIVVIWVKKILFQAVFFLGILFGQEKNIAIFVVDFVQNCLKDAVRRAGQKRKDFMNG